MLDITKFLDVFSNIPINKYTVLLAGIVSLCLIIFKVMEDNKFNKYYDDMKNEKNKEIERLADDNRRYRDIYLKSLGVNQEQIDNMSAANIKKEV